MRYILLTILIAFRIVFLGQTTVLSEDFNDGFPAGWQLFDNDGLTPNSSAGVNFIDEAFVVAEDYDSTGVGDSILVATSWFDEPGEADNWLILPNVTLGSYGNYVSFDAKSVDASHPDGLEVRVSTGGVDLWQFFTLDTVAYGNVAMSPNWTNYTISLDSLGIANQSVFIAFRHISTDNYILALDNIEVTIDDPVSVTENENAFTIYPNPSDNGIFYTDLNQNTSYEVFSVSGKLMDKGTIQGNTLNLSHLQSGVYFCKANNSNPRKIIIQ
ncbi:T9SS-dependent choice-of-anchor J family protein [Parvicella tangerina]|nr:choice-of-anchor J domain-containing protein [Parvicella tangerina]